MATGKNSAAQDLVYTTNYVEGAMTVSDVKGWFQTQMSVFSLGIVVAPGQFGLITRAHLSQHLVGHKSDPEILKVPVSEIMIADPLVVEGSRDVETVVHHLIGVKGNDEDFFNDIIVHDSGKFVGLISVRDLLIHYIEGQTHRLTAMEAQLAALAKKNREMFENTFRQGKQESRYKDLFDHTPAPIVAFDSAGNFVAGNTHFLRLTGHTYKNIDPKSTFGNLFVENYNTISDHLLSQLHNTPGADKQHQYSLTLRTCDNTILPVEAIVGMVAEGNYLMLTVIQTGDPVIDKSVPRRPTDIMEPRAGRAPGKVTQAIKRKLAHSNAVDLARRVASNLIDREDRLGHLTKKLETIMRVAEQIEALGAAGTGPTARRSPNQLSGSLSDFSVIDLSQILVQGAKSGRLVLLTATNHLLGSIYFQNGSIRHAEVNDGPSGIDALPGLLLFRDGNFEFKYNEASPHSTIEGDAMSILMDACHKADVAK